MSLRPLGEQQKRIWMMRQPVADGGEGKTAREVATELGLTMQHVYNSCTEARRKLGIPKMDPAEQIALANRASAAQRHDEQRRPDAAAALLAELADPLQGVAEAIKAAGMPERFGQSLLKRLRTKYQGVLHEVRALKTTDIQKILEEKIDLAAYYLDDKVMAEASARDLGLILTAMTEKRQLLRGEPTAIISNLDREKLHALIPSMIAEARRRGITVEGTAERVG